jgi:hypothetical protein
MHKARQKLQLESTTRDLGGEHEPHAVRVVDRGSLLLELVV